MIILRKLWFLILIFSLAQISEISAAISRENANEIVLRTLDRARVTYSRSNPANYTYLRRTETREFGKGGNLKEEKAKTFLVTKGKNAIQQMSINGEKVSESKLKQVQARELQSQKEVGKSFHFGAGEHWTEFLTPETLERYEFALKGTEELNGRKTYVVGFRPGSAPAKDQEILGRLLGAISGTLWVDAVEFEIAKAQIHLDSEVSLWKGVAGVLRKLDFELCRIRMADGAWFNQTSNGELEGRKLWEPTRMKIKSESFNFQRIQ